MISVLTLVTMIAACRRANKKDAAIKGRTVRCPMQISIHTEFHSSTEHCAVFLSQHGFLVGLCLQTAMNRLSKSDKY